MSRILADLPDDDIKWLDARAAEQGKSRASVLREAVSTFKDLRSVGDSRWIDEGFGLWARHGLAADPHDRGRRRRAEWTRPWDDDYEEARAQSPDLLDAEDDRQREIHLSLLAGRHPQPKSPPRG